MVARTGELKALPADPGAADTATAQFTEQSRRDKARHGVVASGHSGAEWDWA